MIKILFFARLKDQLNCAELNLEIKDIDNESSITIRQLMDYLFKKNSSWQSTFEHQQVFIAINQEIVDQEAILQNGDEVAFFPPVTGG